MKVKKSLTEDINVAVKITPENQKMLDCLRRQQHDIPSRAQMFIRLLELAYKDSTTEAVA